MKNSVLFLLFSGLFLTITASQSYAATPVSVLCLRKGAIVVRETRCRSGETRLGLSNLVSQAVATSAIIGPKGDTGPAGTPGAPGATGPQGNPAGFDVTACYKKISPSNIAFAPNMAGAVTVNCNNPTTEFLLDTSFVTVPSTVQSTKPFLQGKSLNYDVTGKYPVGVIYSFLQAENASLSYSAGVEAICCPR